MAEKKTNAKALYREVSAENAIALFSGGNADPDETLKKHGITRQKLLSVVLADDEVESCIEDLTAEIEANSWRIYPSATSKLSDEEQDWLWGEINKHLDDCVQIAVTARMGGYNVGEIVYKDLVDDGLIGIDYLSNKADQIDKYLPQKDGALKFKGEDEPELIDTAVKHILIRNKPTSKNPMGKAVLSRAYLPVFLRTKGYDFWAVFMDRYAIPFMLGKAGSPTTDLDKMSEAMWGAVQGSVIVVGKDDDIQLLHNSSNGDAFNAFERSANKRIQKLILGRVKISDMENGSRSAVETDDKVRSGRMLSTLKLVSKAVQHLLDALITVNQEYKGKFAGVDKVYFEFEQESEISKERAERDAQLAGTGQIKFTKDYFIDKYDYEENHIEIAEAKEAGAKLSDNRSVQLSDDSKLTGNELEDIAVAQLQDSWQEVSSEMMAELEDKLANVSDYEEAQELLKAVQLSTDKATETLTLSNLIGRGIGDVKD